MKRNTVKNKTTSNEIQRQNHELMNFYILRAFYRCKKGKVRNDLSLLQANVRIQAGGSIYGRRLQTKFHNLTCTAEMYAIVADLREGGTDRRADRRKIAVSVWSIVDYSLLSPISVASIWLLPPGP